jgi:hypothetical protein
MPCAQVLGETPSLSQTCAPTSTGSATKRGSSAGARQGSSVATAQPTCRLRCRRRLRHLVASGRIAAPSLEARRRSHVRPPLTSCQSGHSGNVRAKGSSARGTEAHPSSSSPARASRRTARKAVQPLAGGPTGITGSALVPAAGLGVLHAASSRPPPGGSQTVVRAQCAYPLPVPRGSGCRHRG